MVYMYSRTCVQDDRRQRKKDEEERTKKGQIARAKFQNQPWELLSQLTTVVVSVPARVASKWSDSGMVCIRYL